MAQAGFSAVREQSTTNGTSLSCLLNILITGWKGSFQNAIGKIGSLEKFRVFKHLNIPKGLVENGNDLSGRR
jgi:hypothetical protein